MARVQKNLAKNLSIGLYFGFVLFTFTCSSRAFAQKNPHKQENLNCEACHVTSSWRRIRFNHDSTKFPLFDRHREVDCQSCHNIEDFSKASSDCFSCHEDVHLAKMGADCKKCHTFQGWEIFNVEEIHANSQFPLMGRHTLVDCQSCHQNQQQGDFAMLTTDCISCHQQQYLATENPNHVANSFSTNCQECHEINEWQPAFLPDHDTLFPIFSGRHDGAWKDCLDCHINPAMFSDFTCLACHEHRQSKMDEEHQGIPGYAYESIACLSCHPNGEKGDFEDHDNRFFPIFSGTHQGAWQECVECHVNPATFQVVSCIDCHEHSQTEMDPKHVGITGYAFESSQCYFCHPTGEKGDFADHDMYFPISKGPHDKPCIECHVDPANAKVFECIFCHEHNQQKMDDKHLGKVDNYIFASTACLDCHPEGKNR